MDDTRFHDGGNGDAMSPLFEGGCGCGGVEGGGYFNDTMRDGGAASLVGQFFDPVMRITGVGHIRTAMLGKVPGTEVDLSSTDYASYLALGMVQLTLFILLVLLVFPAMRGEMSLSDPIPIILYVVGGLSAMTLLYTEWSSWGLVITELLISHK